MNQVSKVTTKILPAGWVTLWLGIASTLIVGFIFSDGVLLAFSCFFMGVFIFSLLWGRWNMSKLELSLNLPERVHAAKSFELKTYLDNHKIWLDSYGIEVCVHVLHKLKLKNYSRWVSAGSGAGCCERISVPLRGSAMNLNCELRSTFPLAMFAHESEVQLVHPLIVYPRQILPRELLSFGSLNDVDPQQGMQHGESLGELRGIRAWQPGDSAKRIHWPASARALVRGQGLRIREYDPPGFTPTTCSVVFHSHAIRGEVFRQDRFERATSLVAGTLKYLHGQQVKVKFFADFLAWQDQLCETRSQYIQCLTLLAEARRAMGTELHELQAIVDQQAEKSDQVVIVSDVDPDRWSEGLNLPGNTVVVDIRQMKFSRRSFDNNREVA